MNSQPPQALANHTRFDPPYHYVLIPLVLITLGLSIWNLVRHPHLEAGVLLLLTVCMVLTALKARLYALKAQDRVIRLEERLRLTSLLSEPLRSRIGEITEAQLIALRFAPDSELPSLVEKSLTNGLKPADIKKGIGQWRPDYFRV
ncbi:MAG: DUF6526 family protein [Acidobacteriota bacterium]|nr:DUF6526 family protein [Acidobacteriota bacterium]